MDITVKILDLPNADFPGDNHYIIVESADLNETQKTSLRQLYSYIAKQGIITNVISNQKGIEVTGDSTVKYIKWMPVNWEPNIDFKKDDLITYNQILYKCLIEHISGDTFNSAYFESIGADIQAATADSLGLVKPDGQTIMINSDGMISTSSRNGIFWHVSATEPTENLSTTDYWLNTTTGEIKQYNGSEWGESLGTMRGPEGPQGFRGIKGDKGDKGDTGETGAQGEKGARGPQGVQGLTGPQGPQGEAGAPFTYDMFTEEQLAALTGPQGEKGEKGETGPQGATGAAFTYDMFTSTQLAALVGPQGDSAYDIAVERGFVGNEDLWIKSLQGTTPHIDPVTKNWFIGSKDTGVYAKGEITVKTSAEIYQGTLLKDNWTTTIPFTQSVVLTGISAESRPLIYPILSNNIPQGNNEYSQWGFLTKAISKDNEIIFYCYNFKPTIDLNFEVEVR